MVEVPELSFLMVDGHGDPDGPTFHESVDALYATAYGLKFRVRALDGVDYRVMPLEGLWWIPNARVWDFEDKSDWDWTLMIVQPEVVTPELVRDVTAAVRAKHPSPALGRLRLEAFEEGLSVQTMHVGPWEADTAAPPNGRRCSSPSRPGPGRQAPRDLLSDPGRVEPDRMRRSCASRSCAGPERHAVGEPE